MLNTMQNFLVGVCAGLLLALVFVYGSSRASTAADLPHSFRSGNSCSSSIRGRADLINCDGKPMDYSRYNTKSVEEPPMYD